ncbi:hypothetical protein M011DRAFT_74348 [Sporormia fimetaria CBS 119925]|uniref:Uncharacterized protein n=1 Tax=Sporormia fimetaria CBS 119925 TaxID=1340428 RepID=A0A6A6V959_9PLEO|nr:hypothetical protein M011DRAFT_74348 [Sporormia fimetaria CBS 119925]
MIKFSKADEDRLKYHEIVEKYWDIHVPLTSVSGRVPTTNASNPTSRSALPTFQDSASEPTTEPQHHFPSNLHPCDPKFHETAIMTDVRTLSYRERQALTEGPLLEIYEGDHKLGHAPLRFLNALSDKEVDLEWWTVPGDEDVPRTVLPLSLHFSPVLHLIFWMKDLADAPSAELCNIKRGQNAQQDLMICRAAAAMGIREIYYEHIYDAYWQKFSNLTGEDLTPEIFEEMAWVEALCLDPAKDEMFNLIVHGLHYFGKQKEYNEKMVAFLAEHDKLLIAVEKLEGVSFEQNQEEE